MICPCGRDIPSRNHVVKTIKKAKEYLDNINKNNLPIKIEMFECQSCLRNGFLIYDKNSNIINRTRC